jgi:drug/metabolite transporter (DMT)-like permease
MLAVAWLAITASVVALLATYYIIEKQGAVKSSYINFIMPILAMVVSTLMEGYRWNLMAFAGMVLLIYSTWIGIREHQIEIGERA